MAEVSEVLKIEMGAEQRNASVTDTYQGTLDFDALLTEVLNAHQPRLSEDEHLRCAFWGFRKQVRICEVDVNCGWADANEKAGLIVFATLPLSTADPDEVVWIADTTRAEALPETGEGDVLLIISYRPDGVFPVAFPYTFDAGTIAYDDPIFHDVTVPSGLIDMSMRNLFTLTEDTEFTEEERSFRHIGAALASAYGHRVRFPGDVKLPEEVEPPVIQET